MRNLKIDSCPAQKSTAPDTNKTNLLLCHLACHAKARNKKYHPARAQILPDHQTDNSNLRQCCLKATNKLLSHVENRTNIPCKGGNSPLPELKWIHSSVPGIAGWNTALMSSRHRDSRAARGKVTLEWSLKQRPAKELPKAINIECAAPGGTTALCVQARTPRINSLNLKDPLHTQPFYIKKKKKNNHHKALFYHLPQCCVSFMFPNNLFWPGFYL